MVGPALSSAKGAGEGNGGSLGEVWVGLELGPAPLPGFARPCAIARKGDTAEVARALPPYGLGASQRTCWGSLLVQLSEQIKLGSGATAPVGS